MQSIISAVAVGRPLRLALAYSGGMDSAVLLSLLQAYVTEHPLQTASLTLLHVHHGLSSNADDWVQHCRQQAASRNLRCEVSYIALGATGADGVEATARKKRYAALGAWCQALDIDLLLTAHHQDDQAETMLLQLLRGSGVAGLCGMQRCHQAADLLGNDAVLLARPLLECPRTDLAAYAHHHQISYIEDESNGDPRYARNALRLEVMPLLARYFPGYQRRFARTAQHAQSTLDLIEHFARQDYAGCLITEGVLDAARLSSLPAARIDHVLRYWIAQSGHQMPSTARLGEMRRQLLDARDDAQVCVRHGDIEVHRYRGQLGIASCFAPPTVTPMFNWQGESSLRFAAYRGTLWFEPTLPGEFGIAHEWLIGRTLQLRLRQGGERLRLATNRPSRAIKSHYQSLGIAYWQRERLPFVWADGTLLFAAGVGMNGDFLQADQPGVKLRWQVDTD